MSEVRVSHRQRNRDQIIAGPVGPGLLRMAIPMVWGIMTMMLFGVVDTFFIARLGAEPLAAIGFTFPVVFIVTGTTMGMGIGMSAAVSRAIGENNSQKIAEYTTYGLLLIVILVATFIVAALSLHDPIFRLLGAEEHLIPLIYQYMFPWFCGVVFLVVPMIGNSALRATGDSFTPSLIMVIAGAVNVALDPLLIFGIGPFPRLELQGAALATVISYLVTFIAAFYILIYREKMITFHRPVFRDVAHAWKTILYVGLPAVGTNLLAPLATGILTRIMASYGTTAVAAFGVGARIESLAMVGSYAMATVMAPFAGQNIGAGRADRVRAGLQFGFRYSMTLSFVLWLLLATFSRTIAGWFTDNLEIIEIIRPFLLLVPLSYGGFGFMLQTAAAFNGAHRPKYSVILFFSRLLIFTVPLALVGSHVAGIPGVFAAMFLGNVFSGGLAWLLARRHFSADRSVS
jgi:putative MATE family efflux protein